MFERLNVSRCNQSSRLPLQWKINNQKTKQTQSFFKIDNKLLTSPIPLCTISSEISNDRNYNSFEKKKVTWWTLKPEIYRSSRITETQEFYILESRMPFSICFSSLLSLLLVLFLRGKRMKRGRRKPLPNVQGRRMTVRSSLSVPFSEISLSPLLRLTSTG